jgi:hypothetical protein
MDLIFCGTNRFRSHFNGSAGRQEAISKALMSPFVSMMHEVAQWARIFPTYASKRVFQQPRPKADISPKP